MIRGRSRWWKKSVAVGVLFESNGETYVTSRKRNLTMIFATKAASKLTSVPRQWSNWQERRDSLQFQPPRKKQCCNGKEAIAEIINDSLQKKELEKELKEQRMECSRKTSCWSWAHCIPPVVDLQSSVQVTGPGRARKRTWTHWQEIQRHMGSYIAWV